MASPDARVDAYLAALPDHQRQLLEKLRADVARLVPGAVETISYGMRRALHFNASQPLPDALLEDLVRQRAAEARAKHGY